MYGTKDFGRLCNLISMPKKGNTAAIKRRGIEKVKMMREYCEDAAKCRHAQLLDYFGEPFRQRECADAGGTGEHRCDNCACRITGRRPHWPFPFPEGEWNLVQKEGQRKRKAGAAGRKAPCSDSGQERAKKSTKDAAWGGGGVAVGSATTARVPPSATFTSASAFMAASSMMPASGEGPARKPSMPRSSRGALLARRATSGIDAFLERKTSAGTPALSGGTGRGNDAPSSFALNRRVGLPSASRLKVPLPAAGRSAASRSNGSKISPPDKVQLVYIDDSDDDSVVF